MTKASALSLLLTLILATGLAVAAETPDSDGLTVATASGSVDKAAAGDLPEATLSIRPGQRRRRPAQLHHRGRGPGERRFRPPAHQPGPGRRATPPAWAGSRPGTRWTCCPAVTARTAMERTGFIGRPWLAEYAQERRGGVHPGSPRNGNLATDHRGQPRQARRGPRGQGTPPSILAWDGRRDDGAPAWPGLIYSYVMETVDPAGNPRSVVRPRLRPAGLSPAGRTRGRDGFFRQCGGPDRYFGGGPRSAGRAPHDRDGLVAEPGAGPDRAHRDPRHLPQPGSGPSPGRQGAGCARAPGVRRSGPRWSRWSRWSRMRPDPGVIEIASSLR